MNIGYKHKVTVLIILFGIVLAPLSGCAYPENKQFEYDYLADGIEEIQIAYFYYFSETEYIKGGDYYQYTIIATVPSDQMDAFLNELGKITFVSVRPPESPSGYGVVLTYEDKKIFISSSTFKDTGKNEWYTLERNEQFIALLEKTLGYSLDGA